MTSSPETVAEAAPATSSIAVRAVRAIGLFIFLAAAAGVLVGFVDAHRDSGNPSWSWRALAILAGVGLAICAALFQLFRDIRALFGGMAGLPRRERVSLRLLGIATAAGLVGGVVSVVSKETGWLTDGNGVLSPALAVFCVVLLCTVAPWLTLRWWRAIDEHEQVAYTDGANIAGHFALFAGIGWWALDRAKLVPAPDVMVLIIAMSFVWTGVWMYRRFF
jgi:hypothetical protein